MKEDYKIKIYEKIQTQLNEEKNWIWQLLDDIIAGTYYALSGFNKQKALKAMIDADPKLKALRANKNKLDSELIKKYEAKYKSDPEFKDIVDDLRKKIKK